MQNSITVTQNQLENLSCEVSLLASLALAQQSQINEIAEDKKRYENAELKYHEKWISFDLAVVIEKQAEKLANAIDALIKGGEV